MLAERRRVREGQVPGERDPAGPPPRPWPPVVAQAGVVVGIGPAFRHRGSVALTEASLNVWGSGAHRPDVELVDGAVLKRAGPWSAGVIALLRHLEDVGFDGAPRVIGDGFTADGRLAVTFVPGTSPHPRAWSEEAAGAVGALLRRLHDATAAFVPPAGVIWQPCWLRDLDGADRVIGHCDTGPWNVVATPGSPAAFIDWEYAGPVDRWWRSPRLSGSTRSCTMTTWRSGTNCPTPRREPGTSGRCSTAMACRTGAVRPCSTGLSRSRSTPLVPKRSTAV